VLTALVSKVAPENERGSILGLATSVGSLARFLGPILSGFLFDVARAAGAFYGGAVLMLGALMIAIRMRTTNVRG
jgi:MFS family permease